MDDPVFENPTSSLTDILSPSPTDITSDPEASATTTDLIDSLTSALDDAVTSAATAVSTALDAAVTAINNSSDSSPFELDPGGTTLDGGQDTTIADGNSAINFLLGITIILLSSALNSFGLNLCRLDFIQQSSLPRAQRQKRDYLRWKWVVGMTSYILSQVFGSTLALRYLRSDWVAPLGSTSLVFNFLFAKLLCGTPISREDIRGTALIIVSVILILVFSSINHGLDQTITVDRLATLWSRPHWLSWFFIIILITSAIFTFTSLLSLLLKSRASLSPIVEQYDPTLPPTSSGGRSRDPKPTGIKKAWKWFWSAHKVVEDKALVMLERRLESMGDEQIRFFEGIGWAVVGGSLAGGCLVFTKAVVKLLAQPDKPFAHPVSIITVLMVALTAILQIVCLNKALKAADATLVVPLFYAGYTVLGFVNSLIFMNEAGQYETWVLVAIFLSIALLIAGVVLLSLKKPESPEDATGSGGRGRGRRTGMEDLEGTVSVSGGDPAMRLNPIASGSGRGKGRPISERRASGTRAWADGDGAGSGPSAGIKSAWEVGSDASDDEDEPRKSGIGGTDVPGERGGLLYDAEPMGGDDDDVDQLAKRGYDPDDDEEGKPPGYASVNGGVPDDDAYADVKRGQREGKGADDGDPFGDFEDGR